MSSLRGDGLGLVAGENHGLGCRVNSAKSTARTGLDRMIERGVIAILAGVIAWFFWWTVSPTDARPVLAKEGPGYYNLLASGFLKGSTALDRAVDPALLALKDPYSPSERAGRGLHDASYFKGRYFIYFGVTPVVAVFVPVKLLTGKFVDERFAIVGFAVMGYWVSVLLLLAVRRRCFPEAPVWVVAVGVVVLGLATMVPPLLRRPSIWEVPIAAAYAGFMVTLLCGWKTIAARRRAWLWLAAGSIAMGCTVGARPTYILAAVVLLAPLAARLRDWRRLAPAAMGPIMVIGVALAAYNHVRFGSILEFGQSYQMAGDDLRGLTLFSPGYMAYNFRVYGLAAAGLAPFFPFVTVIDSPPAPAGQFGIENPYGLLPCLPWVGLAWAAFLGASSRGRARELKFFATVALAGALATMAVVFCFGGACGRYMVDFTPTLMVLACIGALALSVRARGLGRWIFASAVVVLGGWSAGFGLLVSFQHNGLLKVEYPEVYRRLAHAFNQPGHAWDRLTGRTYGPVEMEVIFPRGVRGEVEPLVATGRTFRSDYVFVHYLADDQVRFGYEHAGSGGLVGEPVAVQPGAVQKLQIELGSLYPPAAHPYFDGMSAAQARQRQRTIRVTLNGVVALYRSAELFDAVAKAPDIGTAAGRSAFKRPFSGQIIRHSTVEVPASATKADEFGAMRLTVLLPDFSGPRSEPLVSSGETGKGNVVFIKYVDPRTVVFGYDHWGVGAYESEPVTVEPGVEMTLLVDYGGLHPEGGVASGRVTIKVDERVVFDRPAGFHSCPPDTVVVGANLIGASSAGATFTGRVITRERVGR